MQFIIIIIIRGCTFDGVYVPCIYSLVEWEFVYLKFTLDGAEVIYVDLLYVCLVSCTCRADHFSSRRYVHAGKSYAMRSAPSRTMLSTVAFQTVPVPIWLTMPCLFLSERSSSAPGDGRCDVLGFVPVDRVSISSALQQDANNSWWLPGRQCALCFSVSWRLPEERAAPGTGLRPLCRQQGPPPGTPTALHSLMHRNVNCSQSDAERCQLLTVWCREMPTPHNLMQRDANCSQSDAESCQLLTVWCREMPTAYSLMQRNANCLQSDAERCQLLSVWCREMWTPQSDAEMPAAQSDAERCQLLTVWCRDGNSSQSDAERCQLLTDAAKAREQRPGGLPVCALVLDSAFTVGAQNLPTVHQWYHNTVWLPSVSLSQTTNSSKQHCSHCPESSKTDHTSPHLTSSAGFPCIHKYSTNSRLSCATTA